MLAGPFIRDAGPNFTAENIDIELKIGPFAIQPRKIDQHGLKIDPPSQSEAANGQAIVLPFRCAPELGKCLPEQRRGERELVSRKSSRFDLIAGYSRVAEQHHRRSILNPKIEARDVEVRREQRLQSAPVKVERTFRF